MPSPSPSPLSCGPVEVDIDYGGNDIENHQVGDAESCCQMCTGSVECTFWSYGLGKCFMKTSDSGRKTSSGFTSGASGMPAPMPSPSPSPLSCGPVEVDIDYGGHDIENHQVDDAESCC